MVLQLLIRFPMGAIRESLWRIQKDLNHKKSIRWDVQLNVPAV